ncbi:hypothetical protein [Lentzea cavernae]|uniref:Uncharacterized protein n=1 Tax=Lentzea cavernae TaxID=2020703 RepID=A0ABQ3M5T4_9PSEU|nr:hypothetical protein [Lentzea cavernae]GHH33393.1 hypothetical protein GCM10017774_15760 [Lentzea cavernae]
MVVFECVACGAALTIPLRQVDMPDHAGRQVGNGVMDMPALMAPGTYATGQRAVLLSPGDARGMVWDPGLFDKTSCCGISGGELPNLRCECGRLVATRVDDCSLWQVVELETGAVRPVGEQEPAAGWEAFDWEDALLDGADLWWHDRVRIAAGVALARIVLAAGDASVALPAGPVAEVFRHDLDALLPHGPQVRTLALAGPGLAAEADVLLVPRHPQSGEAWPVQGTAVPISAELWCWLANARQQPFIPATGGRWPFLDDDPLPRRPERVVLDQWATRSTLRVETAATASTQVCKDERAPTED